MAVILFALFLVRQRSMRDKHDIEPAEGLDGFQGYLLMQVEIVQVCRETFRLFRPAHLQVTGDSPELLRVSTHEKKMIAVPREELGRFSSDGGCCAADQNFPHIA